MNTIQLDKLWKAARCPHIYAYMHIFIYICWFKTTYSISLQVKSTTWTIYLSFRELWQRKKNNNNTKKAATKYNKTAHQSKWQHETNKQRQWWNGQKALRCRKCPKKQETNGMKKKTHSTENEREKNGNRKGPRKQKTNAHTTKSKLRRNIGKIPKWVRKQPSASLQSHTYTYAYSV